MYDFPRSMHHSKSLWDALRILRLENSNTCLPMVVKDLRDQIPRVEKIIKRRRCYLNCSFFLVNSSYHFFFFFVI